MVTAVLGALPQMANVAALLFFVLAMFALIGNQLFIGLFSNRCFSTITGTQCVLLCSFPKSTIVDSLHLSSCVRARC